MKKNFTISLDIDVQRGFKSACANEGISVSEKINFLMGDYVTGFTGMMKETQQRLDDLEACVTELKEWKLSTTLEATK